MCYFLLSTNENLIAKKIYFREKSQCWAMKFSKAKLLKRHAWKLNLPPSVCLCKNLLLFLPNMLIK